MFSRRYAIMFFLFTLSTAGFSAVAEEGKGLSDPTTPPPVGKSGLRDAEKRQRQPLILQSTIVSAHRRLALINSRIYREGDMVDGARLVSISPGEAILVRGQATIRLRLSGRPVKGERKP